MTECARGIWLEGSEKEIERIVCVVLGKDYFLVSPSIYNYKYHTYPSEIARYQLWDKSIRIANKELTEW